MTFSHFSSSFLSDISCSRSEIKFVFKSGCERKAVIIVEWLRYQTADMVVCGSHPCGFFFVFSSFLIIYSLVGVTVEFKYKSNAKRDYADAGSREEALGRPKLFRK